MSGKELMVRRTKCQAKFKNIPRTLLECFILPDTKISVCEADMGAKLLRLHLHEAESFEAKASALAL